MDRQFLYIFLNIYKCIMANTSAIWQQVAHTTYQLSSLRCSARNIQKSLTHNKTTSRVFWKKSQENGPLAEIWQDRKSKRTRQEKTREDKTGHVQGGHWQTGHVQGGHWHRQNRTCPGWTLTQTKQDMSRVDTDTDKTGHVQGGHWHRQNRTCPGWTDRQNRTCPGWTPTQTKQDIYRVDTDRQNGTCPGWTLTQTKQDMYRVDTDKTGHVQGGHLHK